MSPLYQVYPLTSSSLPVASFTFLVWDILITLDQEAEAIWTCVSPHTHFFSPSPHSLRKPNKFYTKWLFLFVRYFAVAMQMSVHALADRHLLFILSQRPVLRRHSTVPQLPLYEQRLRQMVYLPGSRYPSSHSGRRVHPYCSRCVLLPLSLCRVLIHFNQVHALYDRSRIVTSILVLLFIAENIVMISTLATIVPQVGFDRICTVVQSPPRLLLFA